jgi:cytochrome b6-f complex iron-sulfur subunit
MTDTPVTRRAVLAGACVGCVGLVAACSSGGSSSGGGSGGGAGAAGSAGKDLVALKDVPVGGGVVVDGPHNKVVVAQPSAGQVVAFSAVCTHMGGIVHVEGQQLVCPIHGSRYSLADGSVEQGPAPQPLPKVPVKVSGSEVVTA